MQVNVLVFPLDRPQQKVLLGLKKKGFGQGHWVGIGGKVEAGETIAQAAVRELQEETGLQAQPHNLWYAAYLEFYFEGKPEWNRAVHVFRLEFWNGEPSESEELQPQWFSFQGLPSGQMWADSMEWLPQLLLGQKPRLRISYASDLQTLQSVEALH